MAAPATSDWLTQWQWSWAGILLVLVLGGGYLAAWLRARRRASVGPGRVAFVLLACLLLLYLTCGPIGVLAHTYLWVFALRVALLDAVVPLGLALGRPVEVLAAASGREDVAGAAWMRVARVFMFPAVSSVLGALSVSAVFFTGYGQAALTHPVVDAVLVVHLLLVGSLVVLPLLSGDLLPEWVGPGLRTLVACLDGLLDALPGIVVMTAGGLLMPHFPGFAPDVAAHRGLSPQLDQKYAGGALLAVAESIGIPMLVAVFVDWMRHDERGAVETDRHLDALEGEGELMTPWWVTPSSPTHDDPGHPEPVEGHRESGGASRPGA